MKNVFLTIVILASIDKGTVFVETPNIAINTTAIFGKPTTPTPEGVYLLKKVYSTVLQQNILVFREDEDSLYAIHSTVNVKGQQREERLKSATPMDNKISNGCINIPQKDFDKLWNSKQQMVLQVY